MYFTLRCIQSECGAQQGTFHPTVLLFTASDTGANSIYGNSPVHVSHATAETVFVECVLHLLFVVPHSLQEKWTAFVLYWDSSSEGTEPYHVNAGALL